MMCSGFLEGVGLIRVKNNVGIWFSSTANKNTYAKLLNNRQQMSLKEVEWFYPGEDVEIYKYTGNSNQEDIRILLCQEIINNTSLTDLHKKVLEIFTTDCEGSDVIRIDNYLNTDTGTNVDDPVLTQLEERVSKLAKNCDNSIHNDDELFEKLVNCGFERVSFD
jgi:hypothetical protein